MSCYELKTEPWVHQLKALDFLMVRDIGALYTDMGTGKSKVMIDLIVNRGFKTVLIVTTKKGCKVWKKQFRLHSNIHTRSIFNVSKLSGPDKVTMLREKLSKTSDLDYPRVIICNYDSVWMRPFKDFLLNKAGIDCVICDESHRIKSPGSKCSWFLTYMGRRVKHRYLVTGTPLPENPLDVYAQYRFLDPTIFGTRFDDFANRYRNYDIMRTARAGYPVLQKDKPYIHLKELRKKMFSCAFNIKSSVELPPTISLVEEFDMSEKCQRYYKELKKEGVLELRSGVVEINNVTTRILREQQLTGGYITVEDLDTSEKKVVKVDDSRRLALYDLIEGIPPEEPIVVFAKFRKDFTAIKRVAKELGRGYSEVSGVEDTMTNWEKDKTKILAVQYQSGSESIDLTKARYCIYYTLTHSLGLYLQSLKRTHRPGQEHTVTYYHLVAKAKKFKTIDEEIMEALELKEDVVEYVTRTRRQRKKRLTA